MHAIHPKWLLGVKFLFLGQNLDIVWHKGIKRNHFIFLCVDYYFTFSTMPSSTSVTVLLGSSETANKWTCFLHFCIDSPTLVYMPSSLSLVGSSLQHSPNKWMCLSLLSWSVPSSSWSEMYVVLISIHVSMLYICNCQIHLFHHFQIVQTPIDEYCKDYSSSKPTSHKTQCLIVVTYWHLLGEDYETIPAHILWNIGWKLVQDANFLISTLLKQNEETREYRKPGNVRIIVFRYWNLIELGLYNSN